MSKKSVPPPAPSKGGSPKSIPTPPMKPIPPAQPKKRI